MFIPYTFNIFTHFFYHLANYLYEKCGCVYFLRERGSKGSNLCSVRKLKLKKTPEVIHSLLTHSLPFICNSNASDLNLTY